MHDFWQFPTYLWARSQCRLFLAAFSLKYLTRGLKDCSEQRVLVFLGDGEVDEQKAWAHG